MVEAKKLESSHWWLFESHTKGTPNRSSWLQTALAELDEKTKTMLQLIEEDADSFAQRAEMYYKKRPELITMVEDFYRTHRSLAERYDQVKSESGPRILSSPWSSSSSPIPFAKYHLAKSPSLIDSAYDSYSEAYGPEESDESEVDDPEEEVSETDSKQVLSENEELMRLREEVVRLRGENEAQRELLEEKDEEKREVIRQLCGAMELLREENVKLRECIAKKNTGKDGQVEYSKLRGNFFGRLFNGFGKAPIIAL